MAHVTSVHKLVAVGSAVVSAAVASPEMIDH
jgi:hypothetical protein